MRGGLLGRALALGRVRCMRLGLRRLMTTLPDLRCTSRACSWMTARTVRTTLAAARYCRRALTISGDKGGRERRTGFVGSVVAKTVSLTDVVGRSLWALTQRMGLALRSSLQRSPLMPSRRAAGGRPPAHRAMQRMRYCASTIEAEFPHMETQTTAESSARPIV